MYWLNEHSRHFLDKGYLQPWVSAEERIREIGDIAEKLLKKPWFSDKFYHYMSEWFYSLASPVWSNFWLGRWLPISCFGSFVGDDMGQILYTQAEIGMMSKYGGGTSAYFGDLRGRGSEIKDNGTSSGAVHFMQLFEWLLNVVSQGAVRRGHVSPYLPVEHPDIEEFLKIGTEGNEIQKMTHGVTVTDTWLKDMEAGDVSKRALWAQIIQRRNEMGYPYIMFADTCNRDTVDVYKDKGHRIHASNMCTEIMLPSNERRSFVCCLSSINLLHYDKWKDTDAVETLTYFLDAVMEDFIQKLEALRDHQDPRKRQCFTFMERAYTFAKENRALGLGVLGRHSLLQSKMIPIDSKEAAKINVEVFKFIKEKTYEASAQMATEYGEPELLKGYGRRNSTLLAIAPTTSSAFILGQVSQGIEPVWSNCYVKDIAKIKVTIKNPFLEKLLEEKGYNTKEIWTSIRDNDGSVLHLDILTDEEKEVFKTFQETSQKVLLEQAATRQAFIDQAQSLNLAINPATPVKEINALYLYAWKLGVKTLYYQHSVNAAQQFGRMKDLQNCKSCEA
jgi:ribonucleoside-diphosphate reductase alpha chain